MIYTAYTDAYPNREFATVFDHIRNRIDPVTRALTVRVNYDNHERLLKPGMLMKMKLVKEAGDALMVPEQAIVPMDKRHYVFTVNENNLAERIAVEIGRRFEGKVEVRSGLKEGQQIPSCITTGNSQDITTYHL